MEADERDRALELPVFTHVPAGIRRLHPYQPGMPIEELHRRLGVADAVKLASNENPLGVGPRVTEALTAAASGNLARYPDDGAFRLKDLLAQRHGVTHACITVCNGSNAVLDLFARVFLGPGRAAMYSQYAFAVYPIVTEAQDARAVVVPALPPEHPWMPYGDDLNGFAGLLDDQVALIFLASPNNPTGTWLDADAFGQFMAQVPPSTVVVLDEAYYEFQDPGLRIDSAALLRRYPNLAITRTFSKAFGLAGLRIGYGVSHPQLADLLGRVRQPFNNGTLALVAAEAALGDTTHIDATVENNRVERARLTRRLRGMGLTVLPSQTNFVTVDLLRDAAPVHRALLERGVIVRPMRAYGLPRCLRVSIGLPPDNDRFLATLAEAMQR